MRHFTGSSLTGHGLILFGLRVGPCLIDFNEINLFPAKNVFRQFMWRSRVLCLITHFSQEVFVEEDNILACRSSDLL